MLVRFRLSDPIFADFAFVLLPIKTFLARDSIEKALLLLAKIAKLDMAGNKSDAMPAAAPLKSNKSGCCFTLTHLCQFGEKK